MSFKKLQIIDPNNIGSPDEGHIYFGRDEYGLWEKYSNGVISYITTGSTNAGTSGTSGGAGSSGVDGTFMGSSGSSGIDGISGTHGTSGSSGKSGKDGTAGTSGFGSSGISGSSGKSGTSGSSGKTGSSGTSGYDGTSGTNGFGSSGTSGIGGSSGTSGQDGGYGGASRLWTFSSSDPNTGEFNASGVTNLGLVTNLIISAQDSDIQNVGNWLSEWTGGLLKIEKWGDASIFGIYQGCIAVSISGGRYTISSMYCLNANGILSVSSRYILSFIKTTGSSGTSGVGTSGTSGSGSGTSGTSGSFTEYDLGDVSGNINIDWSNGAYQTCRLTGNISIDSFSNPSNGGSYNIRIKQGTSGGHSVSWPTGTNGVHWPGGPGAAPIQTSTANAIDVYLLLYDNNISWYLGSRYMINIT